jgi:hypothetical protein
MMPSLSRSSARAREPQTVRTAAGQVCGSAGAFGVGAAVVRGIRRAVVGVIGCALVACASSRIPCRSPSACPEGSECLAHRCAPLGAEPVDPGSQRRVLEPSHVAVVHTAGPGRQGLPPQVTLGGPAARSEQLLVRFAPTWQDMQVDTAFLLIEPDRDAEPTAEDVPIEVALAAADWGSGSLSSAPGTRGPVSDGLARTRPPSVLRIDVTAQLREVEREPGKDHGLVVRAVGASTRGAVYQTGADGAGPRLDVYLRPRAQPH